MSFTSFSFDNSECIMHSILLSTRSSLRSPYRDEALCVYEHFISVPCFIVSMPSPLPLLTIRIDNSIFLSFGIVFFASSLFSVSLWCRMCFDCHLKNDSHNLALFTSIEKESKKRQLVSCPPEGRWYSIVVSGGAMTFTVRQLTSRIKIVFHTFSPNKRVFRTFNTNAIDSRNLE